jgi:hypothetical protein
MDSFSQDPQEHLKDFIVKVSKLYGIKSLEGKLMGDHQYGELLQNKIGDHLEEIESEFLKLKKDLFRNLNMSITSPPPTLQSWEFIPMSKGWVQRELGNDQKNLPLSGVKDDKIYLARQERLLNFNKIQREHQGQCDLHKGLDSLSNYYALNFKDKEFVIFESMEYKNAVYVVRGNWKVLSRLTKAELIGKYANKIAHDPAGSWKGKLNSAILINLMQKK